MNFQEMNKLLVAGLAALGVSFGLTMACLNIQGWAEIETSTVDTSFGLSRVCVSSGGNEDCDDIPDKPDWLNAVRGLIITAVIQNGIAVGTTIYFLIKTKMTAKCCNKACPYGVLVNGGLGVTLQTISNIVFGAKYEDDLGDGVELGYAFALHVASSVILLVGALLVFFSPKRESNHFMTDS